MIKKNSVTAYALTVITPYKFLLFIGLVASSCYGLIDALLIWFIKPLLDDGFIAKNYPGKEAEMFDKLSKSQPIGRMGSVDDIAALALYLCSDESSFITGNDYPIDGGFIHLNN